MKTEHSAINQARRLYKEHQLDLVAVVAVNLAGRIKSEKYRIVFKVERRCKHRNIQAQFNFHNDEVAFKCEECKSEMMITEPGPESEPEEEEENSVHNSI